MGFRDGQPVNTDALSTAIVKMVAHTRINALFPLTHLRLCLASWSPVVVLRELEVVTAD